MLLTDLRRDYVRTRVLDADEGAIQVLGDMLEELEALALHQFSEEGVPEKLIWFERSVDVRYKGQEHTVKTPIGGARRRVDVGDLKQATALFHQLHYKAYAFRLDSPCEIVNVHVTAFGKVRKPKIEPIKRSAGSAAKALKSERNVDYDEEGVKRSKIYDRDLLPVGCKVKGPAVVEELACTTLVYPGQTLTVGRFGNLVVDTGA
jgi:N-methylhydantoinase A